jgi:putative endonuclease
MALRKDIGKKGEDEAVHFLEESGYVVMDRNFRFSRNEIDIIAKKNDLLIFVEVKVRSSNNFGFPESFVSDEQANRIMKAAEEYQYQNEWSGNIRFDIISIEKKGQDLKITHFEDAFH